MPAPLITDCKAATSRWRVKEVKEMLAIWGEEKMHAALVVSHRSMDYLESIAQDMVKRGYNRLNIKLICLEYKCMVSQRIRSRAVGGGGGAICCPFFKQLHGTLQNEHSIQDTRVAWNITIIPSHQAVATPPLAEWGDILYTLTLVDIQPPGQALTGRDFHSFRFCVCMGVIPIVIPPFICLCKEALASPRPSLDSVPTDTQPPLACRLYPPPPFTVGSVARAPGG